MESLMANHFFDWVLGLAGWLGWTMAVFELSRVCLFMVLTLK
jgi:hypothetical protein